MMIAKLLGSSGKYFLIFLLKIGLAFKSFND